MRFIIEYHVKDRVFSAYYMVKKNRIKVCEKGRDANLLFEAIKETVKNMTPGKSYEVVWKRVI